MTEEENNTSDSPKSLPDDPASKVSDAVSESDNEDAIYISDEETKVASVEGAFFLGHIEYKELIARLNKARTTVSKVLGPNAQKLTKKSSGRGRDI